MEFLPRAHVPGPLSSRVTYYRVVLKQANTHSSWGSIICRPWSVCVRPYSDFVWLAKQLNVAMAKMRDPKVRFKRSALAQIPLVANYRDRREKDIQVS